MIVMTVLIVTEGFYQCYTSALYCLEVLGPKISYDKMWCFVASVCNDKNGEPWHDKDCAMGFWRLS